MVVHGGGDLRIDEVPDPAPGPGQVLVSVHWGGICGSDLAYAAHGASGTAVLKHPMVLGHEVSGQVVDLGPGVPRDLLGTAVAVHPPTPVGPDPLPTRLSGRTNLHPQVRYLGSAALDPHTHGAFSERLVVRADQALVLPPGLDTHTAVLAEPLGVAIHAIRRAESVLGGPIAGREILINGAGPIGLLAIAAAAHLGAGPITAADVSPSALALARTLGAHRCIDVGIRALPETEVVIEASGVPAALGGVLQATARGGLVVQVGNLPATPAASALGALVTKEITWTGSYRFATEMTEAITMLAAGLPVASLLTHTFALEQAAQAFAVAADPGSGSAKVVLRISPERT